MIRQRISPVDYLRRTLIAIAAGTCLLDCALAQRTGPVTPAAIAPSLEERVDINHASIEDLMKVPGMTRVWAGRIVRFRPYRAKNDLLDHGVVTNEVYARIKDRIIAHRDKQ